MGRFEPAEALRHGRCAWCGDDPLYQAYHDREWGKPVADNRHLFELIALEGAQAGLSWLTVLRKREAYRRAFHNFDPAEVAAMTDADVEKLLTNADLIRNRAKLKSAVTNARAFLEVVAEFGSFERYILSFFPQERRIVNHPRGFSEVPVSTPISDAISADLRRRGFKFFGTTICYAFLQSAGFVDDHFVNCKYKNHYVATD